MAALGEEDLVRLGVLPGHARRMLLRLPTLLAPVAGNAGGSCVAATDGGPPPRRRAVSLSCDWRPGAVTP